MYCLWNGEYGEHDLSHIPGLDGVLKTQAETYQKYIGMVVGDFTCLGVEYDWGKRDQRWKIKCNICGKESYQYHTQDWRRGKGRRLTCACRAEEKKRKEQEEKTERRQKIEKNKNDKIGMEYNGWKVVEYNGYEQCKLRCVNCGIEKRAKISKLLNNEILPCSHRKPNDYSGEEWIGKKEGHLTVIGRSGSSFLTKCDCGRERVVRPTDLFWRKTVRACGQDGCEFSTALQIQSNKKKKDGFAYEKTVEKYLKSLGYDARKTQNMSDYGVDIIVYENDGSKTAIQCKMEKAPSGVSAVQEVYAGGRFYGCTHFCVFCESGFSNPAINMANVLGVYLCEGIYNPPNDWNGCAMEMLPVHNRKGIHQKLYEINGEKHTLADWCAIYKISQTTVYKRMKSGITLETALGLPTSNAKQYTAFGLTGSLNDFARLFDITSPAVSYRMRMKGMTLEEALTAEKTWNKKKNT